MCLIKFRWSFLTLFILCLLTACDDTNKIAKLNSVAPEIKVLDQKNNLVQLSHYPNKKIILEFWSPHCGACVYMMQKLQDFYSKNSQNYMVIAVNTDKEPIDLKDYAKKLKLSFTMVNDQLGMTTERYPVTGTPTTYFINEKGYISGIHSGYSPDLDINQLIAKTYSLEYKK